MTDAELISREGTCLVRQKFRNIWVEEARTDLALQRYACSYQAYYLQFRLHNSTFYTLVSFHLNFFQEGRASLHQSDAKAKVSVPRHQCAEIYPHCMLPKGLCRLTHYVALHALCSISCYCLRILLLTGWSERHMARHKQKDEEAGAEGCGVLNTRKKPQRQD